MAQIQKIIFFTGAVETLGYFSRQLEVHFKEQGYAVFLVDMNDIENAEKHLIKFCRPNETALVTFNFIGLSNEAAFSEKNGASIFEELAVKSYNLLVDHPLYYHKQLSKPPKNMVLFCLDRQHVSFVKQFYPKVEVHFLPTAGNLLLSEEGACPEELVAYEKRSMDVVFIGNYAPLPNLGEHFPMQSKEYIDYYYRIIHDMIDHPKTPFDVALQKHLRLELGELSLEDMKKGMVSLNFIDLYVRTYYRAETIRALVEHGIKVHVFGKDWEKMKTSHRENLILNGGQVDSKTCVKAVADSRISLNTMPWFKDGVHDRIFTSMLHKSVALTDDSIYLREMLSDKKNVCFYDLEHLEELPGMVERLLCDRGQAKEIAENGYALAKRQHTWADRAETIASFF